MKKTVTIFELFLFVVYLLSYGPFLLGILTHSAPFNRAIDPVDECYSPFGEIHILTLIVYFIFFHIAAFLVWIKGRKLPPLTLVLSLVFMFIGLIVNFCVIMQILGHHTESLQSNSKAGDAVVLIITPLLSFIIGILLIIKIILEEKDEALNREFKNNFLNSCNQFLAKRFDAPVWAIIFLLPVFIVVTIILILFGQDVDSIVKVFTDTTTWTFSQKMHPPILDHKGHYLCTVAAKGDPKIVKPVCFGTRHGNTIIVNRQLQIANAFEEMIQDWSPTIHSFIRKNYDKYGYNLSLKINTKTGSNITYILMKPLEWFFLACLYFFCEKPEKKIAKQYRNIGAR